MSKSELYKGLENQLNTVLTTANKHFRKMGYKKTTGNTSELYETSYTKDDKYIGICYWKNTKYAKPTLLQILVENKDEELHSIFEVDHIVEGTDEDIYHSVEANIDRILSFIKSYN